MRVEAPKTKPLPPRAAPFGRSTRASIVIARAAGGGTWNVARFATPPHAPVSPAKEGSRPSAPATVAPRRSAALDPRDIAPATATLCPRASPFFPSPVPLRSCTTALADVAASSGTCRPCPPRADRRPAASRDGGARLCAALDALRRVGCLSAVPRESEARVERSSSAARTPGRTRRAGRARPAGAKGRTSSPRASVSPGSGSAIRFGRPWTLGSHGKTCGIWIWGPELVARRPDRGRGAAGGGGEGRRRAQPARCRERAPDSREGGARTARRAAGAGGRRRGERRGPPPARAPKREVGVDGCVRAGLGNADVARGGAWSDTIAPPRPPAGWGAPNARGRGRAAGRPRSEAGFRRQARGLSLGPARRFSAQRIG